MRSLSDIISIMILTNSTLIYKMVIVATSYYKLYHKEDNTMNKPNTESKAKSNKVEELIIDSFSVNRVHQFDNGGVTFDMTVNGISIYGCRVVETKDGDFIGLPQRKGKDGKYYSIVWARFSEADTKDILAEVEKQLNS